MPEMTPRERLAAAQRELVGALLAGGPVPAGFDGHRVAAEARSLRAKRRSIAAHLRPDLAERLGERFGSLFDSWSAGHPRQVGTSFRADLDRFEAWLYAEGHLDAPRTRRRWFRR